MRVSLRMRPHLGRKGGFQTRLGAHKGVSRPPGMRLQTDDPRISPARRNHSNSRTRRSWCSGGSAGFSSDLALASRCSMLDVPVITVETARVVRAEFVTGGDYRVHVAAQFRLPATALWHEAILQAIPPPMPTSAKTHRPGDRCVFSLPVRIPRYPLALVSLQVEIESRLT